ncbi:MAG: hypothetical protein B7Y52_05305 [Sulfurovum sp. 28-43-6]|nr:MAG: hypothetical protein B7Y52_05305 [Sulfurovum sp. 28-43-6]
MVILGGIVEAAKASGEIESSIAISVSSFAVFATGLVVDSRLSGYDVQNEINLFLDMVLTTNKKGE